MLVPGPFLGSIKTAEVFLLVDFIIGDWLQTDALAILLELLHFVSRLNGDDGDLVLRLRDILLVDEVSDIRTN